MFFILFLSPSLFPSKEPRLTKSGEANEEKVAEGVGIEGDAVLMETGWGAVAAPDEVLGVDVGIDVDKTCVSTKIGTRTL